MFEFQTELFNNIKYFVGNWLDWLECSNKGEYTNAQEEYLIIFL